MRYGDTRNTQTSSQIECKRTFDNSRSSFATNLELVYQEQTLLSLIEQKRQL